MAVRYDYECRACGKVFEEWGTSETKVQKCECGAKADRVWLSQGDRRMLEHPIVLHKHADGSYGVPGGSDIATPPGAERVEIRSMAQYDRVMREWNGYERDKAIRHFDKVQEAREVVIAGGRARIAEQLARTTDPYHKDLLRAALEERPTAARELPFREFFSEAMEMNSSNRDAWWDRERASGRGRK